MVSPLAIFPLRTVLFPHMPMSLHIFEDRYRDMLNDCLEGGTSFGIVAIRDGAEGGRFGHPIPGGNPGQDPPRGAPG